jgi:hypothetical protein
MRSAQYLPIIASQTHEAAGMHQLLVVDGAFGPGKLHGLQKSRHARC